ncbi:MAG: helix-turn-helix transcriptional regulator [Clostridia bacterium]|nr:helix-turn-helix transcriptional regulator [Clostridia bacterium]
MRGGESMGYRLKEIREAKGMTQEELERKSGVSRQTISAIENNNEYQAKSGTLLALANALDTTVDKIFFANAV